MISKLRDDQTLRVVNRDRVQSALQEAKAEAAGIIDWEDAQKVARTIEADYAIMGEVTVFKQQTSGGRGEKAARKRFDLGRPGLGGVTVENIDSQLIGKAALEAVEKFVAAAKPKLN